MAKIRRDSIASDLKRSNANYLDNLVEQSQLRGEHLQVLHNSSTSYSHVTAGAGSVTGSTLSDVAGTITFAGAWAGGDTAKITYETAYEAAPIVMISNPNISGSGGTQGLSKVMMASVTSATDSFTVTTSGLASGSINYFVVENQAG